MAIGCIVFIPIVCYYFMRGLFVLGVALGGILGGIVLVIARMVL